MKTALDQLLEAAHREIPLAKDTVAAEALRVRYLGKKGELSALLRGMGALPAEQRPAFGAAVNAAKAEIERLLAEALGGAARAALEAELSGPRLDVTLPGRRLSARGHRHPVSAALDDVVEILARLGYEVAYGPEVELDYYNFEALNMPAGHSARDMHDTFYVDASPLGERAPPSPALLRTHTSPVQIRTMLDRKPPLRICSPGKVFRRDDDPTHTPMFHQVEVLCVDQGVTFADLAGTLEAFVQAFFGQQFRTRLRPSYFPFVEPGAEVDVTCTLCLGKGCRTCKGTGFVEVLGAGLVHPKVLANVGYDPEEVSGFAFGCGIDRLAMLRSGVDDLRLFFENDLRFLEQA
ncbi:MAG: phenylalanine--tRNA ligase subunit alpha [Myxococcales bacterium]